MSNRWVVICGLVRNEYAFLSKLGILADWKKSGYIQGIVYSTWIDEVDRYPTLKLALAASEATIVESDPPMLIGNGHVFHQMKTLYYGLQAAPSNSLVLKIRPDLSILDDNILQTILDVDLESNLPDGWPQIFSKKIVSPASFIDLPFYINDITFYGLREDLLKLANFDLSTEYLCTITPAEQFFFRPPFSGRFPHIDAFMQVAPHLSYGDEPSAGPRIDALLSSDYYLDVLSINFLILKNYFRIGFLSEEQRKTSDEILNFSIRDIFDSSSLIPGITYHIGAYAAVIGDERALDLILSKKHNDDDLGGRLNAALERVASLEYRTTFPDNPLRPDASVRALSDAVLAVRPDILPRIDQVKDLNGRHYVVRGHSDRLKINTQSDTVRELESEINYLRREVERLTRQTHNAPDNIWQTQPPPSE